MRIAWAGAALLLVAGIGASRALAEWPPPWLKPKAPVQPVYPRILVEPHELADSLGAAGWMVVDARPHSAYRVRHVPGAVNIDVRALRGRVELFADAASRAGLPSAGARAPAVSHVRAAAGVGRTGEPTSGNVLVCCADRDDPAAAGELFWLLEATGHGGVRVLNGGLEAWEAAGLGTHCTTESRAPAFSAAGPDTSRFMDYDRVLAAFGRPGVTILDSRGDSLWDAGHIPHSLPFDVAGAVDARGRIADGPTVRALIGAIGPRPNEFVDLGDRLIVTTGPETEGLPAHPYLLARIAGITDVAGYPGGFSGWARQADAPVVKIVTAAQVRKRIGVRWAPGAKDRPARDFILLDLRTEPDWVRGHLPGAIYIAPDAFEKDFESLVAEHWGEVDRRTIPVVFYCYGPGCIRSRNCSTMAARMGFRNLEWFRDGTLGWRQLGEELVE